MERKTKFLFWDKVKVKAKNDKKWIIIEYRENEDTYKVAFNRISNRDLEHYWNNSFWSISRYWSGALELDLDSEFWDMFSQLHQSERLVKLHNELAKKISRDPWYKRILK